jgi:hypothetical protein
MSKERKTPTILKPLFDEEAALRFASKEPSATLSPEMAKKAKNIPGKAAATKPIHEAGGKDVKQIIIALKKSLYERIAKDAARKDRTVEEHIQKHLAKRYGK